MSVFDLGGRPIVVTGALGRLGTEFCRAFLSQGARVAGLDLAEPSSAKATEWLAGLGAGPNAAYVQGDVTDRPSLARAAETAAGKLGPSSASSTPPGSIPRPMRRRGERPVRDLSAESHGTA